MAVLSEAWKAHRPKARIHVWSSDLLAAVNELGFVEEHASELVSLAAHTLQQYHDRQSQRAVEKVIGAALANETFLKTFTAVLLKLEAGRPNKQAAQVLLRWVGLVLRRLDPEGAKKAVTRLVECLAALLEVLVAQRAAWAPAQRSLHKLLKARPVLCKEFLEGAKSKGSAPLARALFDHGGPEAEAAYPQLLQLYVDKVLGSKERPSDAALGCWAPLLKAASLEQLTGTLLPAGIRMAKRSPDPALFALAQLLRCASPDLSGAPAGELLPTLLQQARHAKEPVRALALDCVRALAPKVSDPLALGALVASTRAVLDGSAEGKIKNAVERVSLCHALCALAGAPGRGSALAGVAAGAADYLCAYYKEELNEEGKAAAVGALAAWLPKCSSGAQDSGALPAAAVARLGDGLKEGKESLRRANLRALAAVLRNSVEARGQLAPLVPGLAKVVNDGVAKAALRIDALLALLACAYIAAADMKADGALEKEKVWSTALKPDSPLLAPATAAKLAADDAALAAELAGVLLTQHAARMGPEATALAARTLALCLLHHAPAPRKAAACAASEVAGVSAAMAGTLVSALSYWVQHPAEVTVMADPADVEAPVALPTVHRRYLSALLHVLPPKGSEVALAPADVAQVLLLAHHPLVSEARRRALSWRPVSHRAAESIKQAVAGSPDELVAGLMGGVNSQDLRQREAAFAAIRSIMAGNAEALAPSLLSALRPLLDTAEHDALTTREIRIYYTPEGKLNNEAPDGSIIPEELYKAQLAAAGPAGAAAQAQAPPPKGISSIPRITHAPKPAEKAAPPRPAARPSAAGAGGKPAGGAGGKGPAKDAAQEARERQLASEVQVRAHVGAIRDALSRGLTALAAAASGAPAWASKALDPLSAPVLRLLTSPLVGEGAGAAAARALAACLPGALGRAGADVGAALRVVALAEQAPTPDYQHVAVQGCAKRAVHALRQATASGAPLPGAAYMFCFPILRAVLSCPEPTPLHEDALAVVSLHVAADVPKPQSFALLYHVLEIIPAYRDRVQPLLRKLCTSTAVNDVEGLTAALQGLAAGPAHVRAAALHALFSAPAIANAQVPQEGAVLVLIWMSRHDPSETNSEVAQQLWEEGGCALPPAFVAPLLPHLRSPHPDVRAAAASGMAEGASLHLEAVGEALGSAVEGYAGQPRASRLGAAALLRAMAGLYGDAELHAALDFLLSQGLTDSDQAVREQMVAAGVAIVDAQGQEAFQEMLPLFESYLEQKAATSGLSEVEYDQVRQGAVVFLGTLARHMEPTNPKVKSVVGTLVEVLTTPSESVQRSVSDCLPPLMQALSGDREFVEGTVQTLLNRCLRGASYGDRRGAAFGLAGVVKGLGIASLKGYGIMDALKAGVENKAEASAREGALCAFECLSEKLGRLFEPYVIHILPMLLVCFGDAQQQVRDAANAAANAIMAQLSGQGVKLVLPALLKGLEDRTWRTKQGSIQLLGAMAHCAPKQLSTCLPTIVPRLGEVLSDPHPKVGQAARLALDEVGSVIRNPEVSALVPVLLGAIADPNAHTKTCLDTLLCTVFVNTVDAPSLALVVPVIHRGLRDRSGDVKKRAARIVGNLCALINDPKDMAPYVGLLLPELQSALIDPLPEVRATAAKAMGSLVSGMGEEHFGDTLPWLLERLRSEASAVERSGAAQGLAEVLAVQGPGQVDSILEDILAGCRARNAAVREGHLTLFRYLPRCMPAEFQKYLAQVLPCILDGLADEAEGVRDAALSAGRIAVELYANSALPLLLPAVEAGIMNANWRIRQSSVELLGDLLFKVAGTTGRIQQDLHNDEEEGISVEAHGQAIMESLGWERRNEVLARVYMARSDVAYTVRSASLHVWKTVVTNTPKTLGEILPALMQQIIASLADPADDRRQMAGRCLGELVRKMGDRVLAQIVPILKEGMGAEEASTRQGVCNGLKEVLENATRHQIAEHLAELMPAIQAALCDPDAATRQAAGGVFNVLFKSGGGSAMESVIPALLQGLESDREHEKALEGLRVVLGVRPQLLGAMLPKLIKPPIHSTSLKALGALAEVAGAAIHGHLSSIMPPLLTLTSQHPDTSPAAAAAHEAVGHVVVSVQEDGLYLLISQMLQGLEDPARRRGAAAAVTAFCKSTRLDFQEQVPSLITALVPLLAEDDQDAVVSCWEALGAVTASIPKEMQPSFVRCLKDAVLTARDKERRKRRPGQLLVAGLCLPKALSPVLPIYLQGVLQGSSAELRELAAEGLGELVEVTGEDALKPFVIQITGPLIRIIGDRFPWEIKAAILHTLGLLISKAGSGLKPFAPQLQTTFLKCLTDPAVKVRQKAASNLGELSRLALRVDQLVSDLAASARSADAACQPAYLTAIQGSLLASGERLSGDTLSKAGDALRAVLAGAGDDEAVLAGAAGALGALAKHCTADELRGMLNAPGGPLGGAPSGRWGERLGAALTSAAVATHAVHRLESEGLLPQFVEAVRKLSRDERQEVKAAAARAAGRLLIFEQAEGPLSVAVLPALVPLAVALLGPDQGSDVQRQMLAVLRRVAGPQLAPHYKDIVPSICSIVQDSAGPTKLAAERTLGRVLQLEVSPDPCAAFLASGQAGPLARTLLTEAFQRRLSRLPPAEDEDAAYAF